MKFLRYPGGKRKLLSFLVNYLPENGDLQGKYIEPFVRGGAVFLFEKPNQALLVIWNNSFLFPNMDILRYTQCHYASYRSC